MIGTATTALRAPAAEGSHLMPSLLSVNVGLPKDVAWQGKTVYTGVWKQPVAGPQMVRRLNIDGDGQGDLAGHGGEQRAVLVYQIQSYQHWQQHFGRDDLELRPVRGEPHRRRPARRRGLHRRPVPHRRGRVRGHPAPRHLLPGRPAARRARAARAAGQPPPAGLLHARHHRGARPGRRPDRQDQDRARRARASPTPTRCSTCPAATPPSCARALRDPGAQPRLAGIVPRPARRRGRRRAAAAPRRAEPAWAGFRPLRVTEVVPESRDGVLDLPRAPRTGSRCRPPGPASTSRCGSPAPASPRPVRSYSLSSAPGARHLPDQRQAGAARRRQRLPAPQPAARRDPRRRRAPRRLRPRRRHRPGPADLGRHRRHAGAGHAAPARGRAAATRDVWWIHGARGPREHRSRPRPTTCSPRCRTRTSTCSTARRRRPNAPRPRRAGRLTEDAGRARRPGRRRAPTSAGRPRSWPTCSDALAALGLDPAAHPHRAVRRAGRRSTPASPGRPRRPPHQPPGPAGTGPLVTFARSGISTPFPAGAHSVLDLADACDVPTRWSCRTGVCHTCVTPLLSGDVAYAPTPLEPPARRRGAHLLRPARHRHRPGHVAGPGQRPGSACPPSGGPG